MVRLNPPSSKAVVDVPDERVTAYVEQGWSRVESESEKAPAKRGRPKKSE